MSSPDSPLQTFHPFPRLATELRLKIWSEYHAMIPPSVIPIHHVEHTTDHSTKSDCDEYPHIYFGPQAIPAILHVNREAREFGLSVYRVGFSASPGLNREGCWWSLDRGGGGHIPKWTSWEHEVDIKRKATIGSEGFLYWNPAKDILELVESSDWRINQKVEKVPLWKGTCKIQSPPIKWLMMTDRKMDEWSSNRQGYHQFKRGESRGDDIFMGMEIIFVQVNSSDIFNWYEWWETSDEMFEYHEERAKQWEGSLKAWIGSQKGKVPEVRLLYFSDPVAEVERMLRLGKGREN